MRSSKEGCSIDEDLFGIEPVFVFAPCCRCGTTLVQRLLNSSGKVIIYGEDHYLLRLLESTHLLLEKRGILESSLRNFLQGQTETWSNAVLPLPKEYLKHATEMLYGQLRKHQEWSESCGFERWGFKYPLEKAETVAMATELVPSARIIFVYRSLYDVVKSAKARRFYDDAHGLRSLARQWNRNLLYMGRSNLRSHANVLFLRYEDLLGDRAVKLREIERFCGIEGIRFEVLDRKINAPIRSKEYGDLPTGYVEPASLTSEECAILNEEAGEAMELFGYHASDDQSRRVHST